MRRRIVKVFRAGSGLNHEPLGTLTLDSEFQRVYWRPYRSRTVETMRMSWLVGLIEHNCNAAGRARRRLQLSRRRRKPVG